MDHDEGNERQTAVLLHACDATNLRSLYLNGFDMLPQSAFKLTERSAATLHHLRLVCSNAAEPLPFGWESADHIFPNLPYLRTLHIKAEVDHGSLKRFMPLVGTCSRLAALLVQDIDHEKILALLQTLRGSLRSLSLPYWSSNFAQYVPALRSLAIHEDLFAFRAGPTPPAMPHTIRQLTLHRDWLEVDEEDRLYNWLQIRT